MRFFKILVLIVSLILPVYAGTSPTVDDTIADQLGWVNSDTNRCSGYYLEPPFYYPEDLLKKHLIEYTNPGPTLFSLRGTSVLQGNIKVTQYGQQVTTSKAYLYRDPTTGKINAMDLLGQVHLREPSTLIVAKKGYLNLKTQNQSLDDLLYRTTIYASGTARPAIPQNKELQKERKITQLSAWGQAVSFVKNEPKVYEFEEATYSTCPPNTSIWHVKAKHIKLNKNTGRGTATHARLYVKSVPIFYSPYLNFAIDKRRQTGFLNPYFASNSLSGPYVGIPFYWNMAPNYDDTITPVFLSKRGLQLNNLYRYLTPKHEGGLKIGVLPNDRAFSNFQTTAQAQFQSIQDPTVQANLHRLKNASPTRGALSWQDEARYNPHWSSSVDYSAVTDDYYLQDFSHDLNGTTTNQLIQKADATYQGKHWNFTGRVQQYQTLHPVDSQVSFQNQYIRLPQLVLTGDYADSPGGFDYFTSNELTRFDIRKMPGSSQVFPIGNRAHVQPGVSWPINLPYLYLTPRVQFALSKYTLKNTANTMSSTADRALPIVDFSTGMFFDRDLSLLGYDLRQTLEPQIYYVYIPYRNQEDLPIFDTTENTLTYSQIFTYNRFSGLDRIGDTNQVSLGITTRFLDKETGNERIHIGVGEIIYFANRRVTLCTVNDVNCPSSTQRDYNRLRRSPITGVINYHLNPYWSLTSNTIWNTQMNKMDNQTVGLQYNPSPQRVFNIGYNFVRNGDMQPNLPPNSSGNNLKQFNISAAWPIMRNWSAVGQWIQSVNQARFQNLLYGIQYDSCCWAARLVAGRNFLNNDLTGRPVYDNKVYVQFALRGLTNVGTDPTPLLSSGISGYTPNFGQNF